MAVYITTAGDPSGEKTAAVVSELVAAGIHVIVNEDYDPR